MHDASYTRRLKEALVGDPDARFVWLCNFEVENEWARNYVGLPAAPLSVTTATVQRMEELGAMLAEPGDHLVLSQGLDAGYRDYAGSIGFPLPTELVAEAEGSTSEAVLDSPEVIARLTELAGTGAYLMPMGNSMVEQRISERTGLPLAVPDTEVYERVNSKIYSRRLVEELGLRAIPGFCCESTVELHTALESVSEADPVIVKDAYGVSGKGLVVVDSRRKADRLLRMVDQRARRKDDQTLHVVAERFLAKRFDLNYQITISREGAVTLDFVKEAMVSGGVHMGHIMPPDLSAEQLDEIAEAAERIGARLHADGFHGVVGVDALVSADDVVYPVLELNARLNMSTYQGQVTERFQAPDGVALAKHYPLRLAEPVPFEEIRDGLGALAQAPADGRGLVLTCFGTVNAQAGSGPFEGRLYTVLFGHDRDELHELDRAVTDALAKIEAERGAA
ncbi:ATP-grasp domain-containing protein [Saccharopolyspora taberi]|uniref:ATP-grasp domain-containing protein n=1 Tax=Saccharopolyspora taberi TaxID=60895 RepID=A0ABN3VAX4_9PSEU